jgi:hypothetical protein
MGRVGASRQVCANGSSSSYRYVHVSCDDGVMAFFGGGGGAGRGAFSKDNGVRLCEHES